MGWEVIFVLSYEFPPESVGVQGHVVASTRAVALLLLIVLLSDVNNHPADLFSSKFEPVDIGGLVDIEVVGLRVVLEEFALS